MKTRYDDYAQAVKCANRLAKRFGGRFHVAHAVFRLSDTDPMYQVLSDAQIASTTYKDAHLLYSSDCI